MTQQAASELAVYQGQFGIFNYAGRSHGAHLPHRLDGSCPQLCHRQRRVLLNNNLDVLQVVPPLFACFCLDWALANHNSYLLSPSAPDTSGLLGIGTLVTVALALCSSDLALTVYNYRPALFGVSFIFAADRDLFQRAFCFNRLETKLLTPGADSATGTFGRRFASPVGTGNACQLGCFVCRVCTPQGCASNSTDIGDKSVFAI